MIQKLRLKLNALDDKSRVLYRNIIQSFGVKGLAILVSLVNMPVFMGYFQDHLILGLWFTMLSMLNWILTFDLGIGNGLRNYLVIALEKNDRRECAGLISSAYCSIGAMMLLLSVLTFALLPHFDWNSICNIPESSISPQVLIHSLRILLVGVWVQFLLKLINTILYAMQKSAIPNFLLLSSNILLLLSTFFLNSGDAAANLIRLSYAYIFTANTPILIATVLVFTHELRDIRIRISDWTLRHTKQIVGLGCSFLALQLLSMASFNTREFYIMRFISPAGVVPYQVYQRIFSLISTFFVLATTPFWSAITQAYAQRDSAWIRRTYKKGLVLFSLFSLGSIVVVLMAPLLVKIWLGKQAIEINLGYSILFALFNIEYMWINLHCHFENGMGRLKIQKIGYLLSAVLLPVVSWLLAARSGSWITVLAANILVLLPLSLMQPFYLKKSMQLLQNP